MAGGGGGGGGGSIQVKNAGAAHGVQPYVRIWSIMQIEESTRKMVPITRRASSVLEMYVC